MQCELGGLAMRQAIEHVREHGLFKRANSCVAATTNASFRQLPEEPLDQIQPTGAGRREVNVIARVPCQPAAHLRNLVGAVVVHDQMHLEAARKVSFYLVEES